MHDTWGKASKENQTRHREDKNTMGTHCMCSPRKEHSLRGWGRSSGGRASSFGVSTSFQHMKVTGASDSSFNQQ